MPPKSMKAVKVDGEWYRAETYGYRSCDEVLIRGPFPEGVFHPNGKPVFMRGCCAAFKVVGKVARATNRNRSKKMQGEATLDWRPFAEALGWEVL